MLLLVSVCVPTLATTINVPGNQRTIQEGINAASAGDTVLVACGTYFEHDIVLTVGVTLMGETGEPDGVTIDAEELGRVLYMSGLDEPPTIAGLTLTRGQHQYGGGLVCVNSDLVVTRCIVADCTATTSNAGGLYASNSTLLLEDSHFVGNEAQYSGAGVLCIGDMVAERCVFADNFASCGSGGLECSGNTTLTDCTFSNNFGTYGSGANLRASSIIVGCVFENNTSAGSGGGLLIAKGGEIADCTFLENTSLSGGAIAGRLLSTPLMVGNCRFVGNIGDGPSGSGGGVAVNLKPGGSAEFLGCLFAENEAAEGAAVCAIATDGRLVSLRQCTVANNLASGTGVLVTKGVSLALERVIVAMNSEGVPVICEDGGVATLICSDVFGNAGGDWVGCIADQYGFDDNFSENPLFCLSENLDEPYSLHDGSPCLPDRSPCGEAVGAFGMGCHEVTPVAETTWGALKVMFR